MSAFVLKLIKPICSFLSYHPQFKEKFYRTPWAKLADARPGTLRLAPPKGRLDELAADYASMRPMLFGNYPSIDEIVAYMAELEETINGLS